jgi:hypothetical protein
MALAGLLLSCCLGPAEIVEMLEGERELGWRMATLGSEGGVLLLELNKIIAELHVSTVQSVVPRLQICIFFTVSPIDIGQSSGLLGSLN